MKTDTETAPDTRVMGIVHSALRRDLERTRIVLADVQPVSEQRRSALADHLVWMMAFLDRHHTGEDEGLYPMVLQKNPGARELLADMDTEHQQIHPAMDRLAEVAKCFGRGTATQAELLSAVEELAVVLYPHLKREEEELMPVVAASISAADWQRWDQEHNVKGLRFGELAATGLWILDGQDPVSDALMSRVVPPPVRLIVKKGFGPGYRRKTALLWGGTRAAGVPALAGETMEHPA